jgi:hypothetical protein
LRYIHAFTESALRGALGASGFARKHTGGFAQDELNCGNTAKPVPTQDVDAR